MKTLYGILIISLFGLSTFFGISNINDHALSKGHLDIESLNTISLYDSQFKNYLQNYSSLNISTEEPNVDVEGDFFKEYADLKGRFDQFRDSMNMLYRIPDMIFIPMNFIDEEDLSFYRNILWFLITAIIGIVIYKGLKSGVVDEE